MAKQPLNVKHAKPGSNARVAKFVFSELLEGDVERAQPFNPKWRSLEEQSYLVLTNLRVLRSYLEARYQRGLNSAAVGDCVTLLEPVIGFLNAVDLTALVMMKEKEQRGERGKGKAA